MAFDRNKRRVVVTGMGVITPIGNTVAEYWQALIAGKSGAYPITLFDASVYKQSLHARSKALILSIIWIENLHSVPIYLLSMELPPVRKQ